MTIRTDKEALHKALLDFPANGKLDGDTALELVLVGFAQEHEVKEGCRNCGTPLTKFRYFKITQAGRLFMEAMTLRTQATTRGGGS